MLRNLRGNICGFGGTLALLFLTSAATFGQTAQNQALSGQSSNEQSTSNTSSSATSLSGQSLADVARANREKKAADASTASPKVITNADLPKNPEGYTGPPSDDEKRSNRPSGNTAREEAQQKALERASGVWRQQIVAQTNKIAMLQTRIDRFRAQIHVVDPNANYDDAAGTSYNGAQATQIRILKDMEEELRQQQQRLQDMQDSARRAGMHTAVYDP